MTAVCVVDTCSLIYLSGIELGNRTLHQWLWEEFTVLYSQTVWEEIQNHLREMEQDESRLRRNGAEQVRPLTTITTCERALFAPPFYRQLEVTRCKRCKQPSLERRLFEPNLEQVESRGERHNCCVALDVILTRTSQQVVFLTDDERAIRDFVAPVFDVFPLGSIWSSHDLILHLFMRHRQHIPRAAANNAIRDVVAKATRAMQGQPENKVQRAKNKWMRKHTAYREKIGRIDQVLNQFRGGH